MHWGCPIRSKVSKPGGLGKPFSRGPRPFFFINTFEEELNLNIGYFTKKKLLRARVRDGIEEITRVIIIQLVALHDWYSTEQLIGIPEPWYNKRNFTWACPRLAVQKPRYVLTKSYENDQNESFWRGSNGSPELRNASKHPLKQPVARQRDPKRSLDMKNERNVINVNISLEHMLKIIQNTLCKASTNLLVIRNFAMKVSGV